ncbi:MAG TPA: glycosyltransferase family 39 protein [Blastocatellia bacterium]|nr:glycosyltransferase family 39 protein [Blastocatellia bacterium]
MSVIKWRLLLNRVRRWLVDALGTGQRLSFRNTLLIALLIFLVSFSIRSLVAVDLSPVMHTIAQPAGAMASELDARAVSIAEGHGILLPDNHDPTDTSILAHSPGYPIMLGAIYATLARSYFTVQIIQNALNSIAPLMIFAIAGILFGWRVGTVAGFLAAVSHHFSYYSNFILPDSLCALPILGAVYSLVLAERSRQRPIWLYALAGFLIGVSIWLRPNALALAPFLGLTLILFSPRLKQTGTRAGVMILAAILTILPITIRNYLLYDDLVLVRIGAGIVMWEGLAEYGGKEFGAVVNDDEVARQEAVWYNEPAYANTWQTPDGIKRDRDRLKRSVAVIFAHPFWYSGTVIKRMGDMFDYTAQAPLVFRNTDNKLREAGEEARREMETRVERGRPLRSSEHPGISPGHSLAFGNSLVWIRPLFRALQRVAKETMLLFVMIGLPVVFLVSRRRAFFILLVPLYYLVMQGTMHIEFRYTLPMQYFVFVFAAATWVLLVAGIWSVVRRRFRTGSKVPARTGNPMRDFTTLSVSVPSRQQ